MKATTTLLADGARQGKDGKLYIFGAVWDRIFATSVPTVHPIMAVVVVLEVGYHEALKAHDVEIWLRREDGRPVGPRMSGTINVGHPPWLEPGASLSVPVVFEQQGITFDAYGRYEWIVQVGGEELSRIALAVSPTPVQPQASGT
jgi:hypothetical protein